MSEDPVEKESGQDFQSEIECMMYSFGDSGHPNPETVKLIEKITHSQVTETFAKATGVAQQKGKRVVCVDDILFLLRKNTDKLKTVLRHLAVRDMAKKAKTTDSDDFYSSQPHTKKPKFSLDFLNMSEQASVGSQEHDSSYIQTLQHMDDLTRGMTQTEYIHYTQCRQANFHKNTAKFKNWLEAGSQTDMKPTQEVVEVLGYLAYETVKEIVELSLRVKEDSEHKLLSAKISTSLLPCSPSKFGSTPTFFTVPADPPNQPLSPPPPLSQSPPSSPLAQEEHSRKSKEDHRLQRDPIQPKHVREALRRCSCASGPLTPLTTHFSKTTFYQGTLCT